MWEPDPSWRRLPGAGGPSSAGVWLADDDGRTWVVKRLEAPDGTTPALLDPAHAGYWRREAEVARDPAVLGRVGLVPPEFGPVEEDDEGLTVWSAEMAGESPPGLFVARALGRFAAAPYDAPAWAARRLLENRLAMAAERGGWPTLARTTLADVTDRLWERRGHWLSLCAEAPQGRVHGDAVPTNFVAARGEDVVAVDWQCFGTGPVGADLGYFALSSREEFGVLLETFLDGAGPGVDADVVALAARVTAVYSVVTRAEWALAQVARGEGALAGKYRHPAVAPHLRALQRQFPQIEPLL
ncbi:aminoglycoside phosphotransferase family protein [Marmoricola sp. URHB0036]|uniref:aminoglycoside phosphotransferase family protein n=1 Tax=Marmoricola sp. URHB0036 TaxID=1298863 RepID=UPI000419EAEA|nr:aminoglycoside phosphotransferase family protein [Marmoricola sp. URHB0036]